MKQAQYIRKYVFGNRMWRNGILCLNAVLNAHTE